MDANGKAVAQIFGGIHGGHGPEVAKAEDFRVDVYGASSVVVTPLSTIFDYVKNMTEIRDFEGKMLTPGATLGSCIPQTPN